MIEELKKSLNEVYLESFAGLKDQFIVFFPKLVIGMVVLLAGWVTAVMVCKILTKVLRAFGLDVMSEKLGLTEYLETRDVHQSPSALFGWLGYWLILMGALIIAFEQMDLPAAAELVKSVLAFIPRLFAAMALLALGFFLSGVAGNFVDRLARVAHIPFHAILGQIARYSLIGLAIANALEYLHLASSQIIQLGFLIVGVVTVLTLLVFMVSGRDVLGGMLSQRFIAASLDLGDRIKVNGIEGTVHRIGSIATELKTDTGIVFIPNQDILHSVREKVSAGDPNQTASQKNS